MCRKKKYPVSREDLPEFIGQILDSFEDFLDENGVVLPAQEDDPEEDDDLDVNVVLKGDNYSRLEADVEEVLVRWGIARAQE